MTESKRDLTERTFAFGVRVVALCRALDRREPTSRILAGQLLRSGTSVGAKLEDIRGHGHILTPGRYVGAEPQAEDSEPLAAKMARLTKELDAQFAESAKLEAEIRKNLGGLKI